MRQENTPLGERSLLALLAKVSSGWSADHSGVVEELIRRLRQKLSSSFETKCVDDDCLRLEVDLRSIHLRGMNEAPCLVMSGGGNIKVAREFLRQSSQPRLVPFVLTLSESALEMAKEIFPRGRFLLLSPGEVKELMRADNAHVYFTSRLREQIPTNRLVPYNILLPADDVTFFGRRSELDRLCNDEMTSYAIAGPGRVGKTSLVKRYESEMKRRRDPRMHCREYLSFLECNDKGSDGVARFVGMKVMASSRSDSMDTDKLLSSLKHHFRGIGGPMDLLMDEVDLVCQTEAFSILGEAARMGLCRIILCGRGVLLRTMLDDKAPLANRLSLIRLGPLEQSAATELIVKPLTDLGFVFQDQEAFVEKTLRLTGCLPHLVQFYGKQLSEMVTAGGGNEIRMAHLDEFMSDFINVQFLIQPLNDLADPDTRLAGLLLVKEDAKNYPVKKVQDLMARFKVKLSIRRAMEVCNELVINNVLTWQNNLYRVANEGLGHYARTTEYLDQAILEAMEEISVLMPASMGN
jgi:hypothetical protein